MLPEKIFKKSLVLIIVYFWYTSTWLEQNPILEWHSLDIADLASTNIISNFSLIWKYHKLGIDHDIGYYHALEIMILSTELERFFENTSITWKRVLLWTSYSDCWIWQLDSFVINYALTRYLKHILRDSAYRHASAFVITVIQSIYCEENILQYKN